MKQIQSDDFHDGDLVKRYRVQILALVLVLVVFVAHGISLWNGLVLDDHFNVSELRNIVAKEWGPFWSDFIAQAVIHPLWQPLLKGSIAFDYQSGRLDAALYHGSNLLWHCAAVLSAYFLLLRLVPYFDKAQKNPVGNNLVPFLACLIFACHPITSESVAYISGRSGILLFVWYMVALQAFIVSFNIVSILPGMFGALVSVISLILAVYSSPQGITVPESMLVLALLLKPHGERLKDWIYERFSESVSVLLMCVALPCVFFIPNAVPDGRGLALPLMAPVPFMASQLKTLVSYYCRVFFVPVPLSIAPPYCHADSFADPLTIAGLAVIGAAVLGLVKLRKDPFAFFGLWIFLIGLLPQSFFISSNYASAAHFYLSCFGLCLLVARLLINFALARTDTELNERNLKYEPRVVAPVVLMILLLIGLSNYRDRGYSTDSALLRGAMRASLGDKNLDKDGYWRSLLSFMLVLNGGDNIDRGMIEARRALDINRNLPLAYLAMAKSAMLRNDFDGAKYYAEKTLQLAREQHGSRQIVGLADGVVLISSVELNDFSQPAKLKALAKDATLYDPANPKLYAALARVYLSEHKRESGIMALKELAHARRLDVNDPAFTIPIAEAQLATGDPAKFESAYQAASLLHRIAPTDGSRLLLARCALETGRINKGFIMIKELMDRQRGKLDAQQSLIASYLYKQSNNPERARELLAQARKVDPKIEDKVHIWLRIKPLTPIQQAREEAFEKGKPIQEKIKTPVL